MLTAAVVSAADYPDVSANIAPRKAQLGQPLDLTVTVRAGDLSRVSVSNPFTAKQTTWTLVSKTDPKDQKTKDGQWERKFTYRIAPFETGDVAAPPVDVIYTGADGKQTTGTANAGMVQVENPLKGVTGPPAGLPLKDLKPPVAVPFPLWIWVLTVLAAVLVLLFVVLALWRVLRRKVQVLVSPPVRLDQWALQELDGLEREKLVEQKKIKEHYTRVTDVVRQYLGRLFGFDAIDMTSGELLSRLDETPISKSVYVMTNELLDEADLVKFAKVIPDTPKCRGALEKGRELVRQTAHFLERAPEQESQASRDRTTPPPSQPPDIQPRPATMAERYRQLAKEKS